MSNPQKIIAHHLACVNKDSIADKLNVFHMEIIQNRLKQSTLTPNQKISVLNKILENLKSQEVGSIIK